MTVDVYMKAVERLRADLHECPAHLEGAYAAARLANDEAKARNRAYSDTLEEAEDVLAATRFTMISNKTWLCGPDGAAERTMDAKERQAWTARTARQLPEVAHAEREANNAELALAEARDAVSVEEKRLLAISAELAAAVVQLQVISHAQPS